MLLVRALLSVFLLPGLLAVALPWWIASQDPWRTGGVSAGLLVHGAGLGIVMLCVRDFLVVGRGTLAPWDPPRHLVVTGLYRYVRNPMYFGVFFIVLGTALAAGSPLVLGYLAVAAVPVVVRTVYYEEPQLAAQFGAAYARYLASVPRFLPRLTPWEPPEENTRTPG